MQPKLELLSKELTNRILDEAFELLMNPEIKVQSRQARKILADHQPDPLGPKLSKEFSRIIVELEKKG